MSAITSVFSKSIGRKFIMGLTGLFLVSFLIVHLSGNLQLFLNDGGLAFNIYTKFMTTNPLIKIAEWILFGGFIIHIIYAAILTNQNRKARPEKYAYSKLGGSSSWFSRNMGLSGTIVMIFLAVHLTMFWGVYKFGGGEKVTVEQAHKMVWKINDNKGIAALEGVKYIDDKLYDSLAANERQAEVMGYSMYEVTMDSFRQLWIVILYVVAMILLGLHLNHGFQSAFRTLGLVHEKYTPIISMAGKAIAIIFPAVFAAMPIFLYIKSLS